MHASVHVHVHEGVAKVQWFKISIRTSVSHRINPSKVRTFVPALIWGADKWDTCTVVTSLIFSREKMNTNAYTWPSIVALCSPSLVVTYFIPRPQSVWEQDLDCNHVATSEIIWQWQQAKHNYKWERAVQQSEYDQMDSMLLPGHFVWAAIEIGGTLAVLSRSLADGRPLQLYCRCSLHLAHKTVMLAINLHAPAVDVDCNCCCRRATCFFSCIISLSSSEAEESIMYAGSGGENISQARFFKAWIVTKVCNFFSLLACFIFLLIRFSL